MKTQLTRVALVAGLFAMAAVAPQAQAAFVLVENFNALADGAVNGQNGWTADNSSVDVISTSPASASDKALESGGPSTEAYKTIPTIANGSIGTVFFQFNADVLTAGSSFGLADTTISGGIFESYRPQIALNATGDFLVRDGGSFDTVDQAVSADTWYSIWMVADNSAANTYEVYIQGGAFGSQTQLTAGSGAQSVFAFRNDETGGADLTNFLFAHGGGTDNAIVVDNIYVDAAGENLTDPISAVIPVPAALPAGLMLMGALVIRRK
ncbi:hypothetical protein HED60_11925 [Planctomycetales bacterium ZRK34]|nr:hypothetical protein HED60_11925 [Planctomycetales bacterium ZRK34]